MTSENNGMYMPVAPAYGYGYGGGNDGFGGNSAWWLLILLVALGGWGGNGFGFGGNGGFFPWMMGGQMNTNNDVQRGFDQSAIMSGINGINTAVTTGFGNVQNSLCSGFGNVQNALCSGFAGVNATVNGAQNAIAQQLYGNEIASLNRSFAEQTANTAGFTGLTAGVADLKYTMASEAAATRANCDDNNQKVLDKLCQLELDGVKNQLAQAQRENVGLQNQLNMANLAASQNAQTAQIRESIIGELRSCPIPAQPVYGSQPIFTCGGGQTVGCGCSGFAA